MAVTLNASTSAGLIQTADTSGVISLQNNGTTGLSLTSGNLQFNSGYGSVATAYGCRAWVNFNGTGTPAIRASGNVSSITDNGTGDYTVNFTNAMPDINYCPAFYLAIYFDSRATVNNRTLGNSTRTTSGFRFQTTWTSATTGGASVEDIPDINIAIFR